MMGASSSLCMIVMAPVGQCVMQALHITQFCSFTGYDLPFLITKTFEGQTW